MSEALMAQKDLQFVGLYEAIFGAFGVQHCTAALVTCNRRVLESDGTFFLMNRILRTFITIFWAICNFG
jgi:hypothetical protein